MMIQKNNIKKNLFTGMAAVAKKASQFSSNNACMWWQYQPKMPQSVKKMREF